MNQDTTNIGTSHTAALSSEDVAADISQQTPRSGYMPGGEGDLKSNTGQVMGKKQENTQMETSGIPAAEPVEDTAKLCELHRKRAEAAIKSKKQKQAIWNDPNATFSDKASAGAGIVKDWFSEKKHGLQMGKVEKEKLDVKKKSGGLEPGMPTTVSPPAAPLNPTAPKTEGNLPPSAPLPK